MLAAQRCLVDVEMLYFIYRDCVLKRLLFEMTGTIWIGLSAYYFIVKNWAKIKGIENYIKYSVDSYKSRRKRRKNWVLLY